MRAVQVDFLFQDGVNDIWSNSKIFEILQANTVGHTLIPGHSGSLDAKDDLGNEYEYKHFKESSSNHSWTFNDFSDSTISKLEKHVHSVVFGHIQDNTQTPKMDWAYVVPGKDVAHYLEVHTPNIQNSRKMINISARNIETRIGTQKTHYGESAVDGAYTGRLRQIFQITTELEKKIGVVNILTSNKLWEVLVSLPLSHTVNSEQGGRSGAHDAFDEDGNDYEYKVSSSSSWNFQDISENVLVKYLNCKSIVLATVNKPELQVNKIWFADPEPVVKRLRIKLKEKEARYYSRGETPRRKQASLSKSDLQLVGAKLVLARSSAFD